MKLTSIDKTLIAWFGRTFIPVARLAIFVVFFYFGALKLFGQSPATPLAHALVTKTLGAAHFGFWFKLLAVLECLIGILFLLPKATRIVIPLLLIHMLVVCSPLFIIPHAVWSKPFVPTLEGQYIIKNIAIIALAIGIASQTKPLDRRAGR